MTSRPLTAKLQTILLGLVLALILFLAGCAHPPREEVKPRASGSIIKTARLQMGAPLRRGGTSPRSGFDCSGFVQWVFEQHGLNLARTTREQKRQGRRVKKKALRPADLVFFSSPKSRGRVSHVGIYLGRAVI